MADMIERIARAGAIKRWGNDEDWVYFTTFAHIALKAMREPTGAMIEAGLPYHHRDVRTPEAVTRHWQAMVDAALNEKQVD